MTDDFAQPTLVPFADFLVDVGEPVVVGQMSAGLRRVVPILGGTVTGRLAGTIDAGGADYQVLGDDGTAILEARYTILTATGSRVYVVNHGMRSGPKHVMDALARGESVNPAHVYFRAAPRFETGDPNLHWLTQRLFVATGVRRPTRVDLRIYELA